MNNKRFVDWYQVQKDVQGWNYIPADLFVASKLIPQNLSLNLDYCHRGLKNLLIDFEAIPYEQPDFFVITELELGKISLSELFSLYETSYKQSRYGIYVAALSYYLEPDQVDSTLKDSYSKNIDTVFRKNFHYADRVEDYSVVTDQPLKDLDDNGCLVEGSNYIFVHPNIRYFLWKSN
jgi:hypothetical protein